MYYGSGLTNILITGAGGQIGSALSKRLGVRAIPLNHRRLNIADCDMVEAVMQREEPQAIVNCAGFNNVRRCDSDTRWGWEANSVGVANLANVASRLAIPFIHVSSDFVFGQDENRDTPYDEDSPTGPVSNYGFSKLAGEFEVLQRAVRYPDWEYAIVRTAGVFSMPSERWGKNFFRFITEAVKLKSDIPIVNDVMTNITRAEDLAEALAWFVFNITAATAGIYHVTNPGCLTWYDAALLTIGQKVMSSTKAEYAWQVSVPAEVIPDYTCLSQRKYLELGGPELPPWDEAVKELAAALEVKVDQQ